MKKDHSEREPRQKERKEVKNLVKDSRQDKGGSGKHADRIPTPQGSKK